MEPDFWMDRWQRGRIGFHQSRINEQLERHLPELGLERGDAVLVPLCGKSHDMLWLAANGYAVIGVELVELAVRAFFEENGLVATTEPAGALTAYRSDALTILNGDIFDVRAEDVSAVRAVYDRAALIALPREMRRRYVEHLVAVLPPEWSWLLLTIEYDESTRSGPPFSVRDDEVRELFDAHADVTLLERRGSSRANDADDVREATWSIRSRGAR
jgi:thiopurine S-methyltransferase